VYGTCKNIIHSKDIITIGPQNSEISIDTGPQYYYDPQGETHLQCWLVPEKLKVLSLYFLLIRKYEISVRVPGMAFFLVYLLILELSFTFSMNMEVRFFIFP